jgi:hypothetical protein
MGMEAPQAEVAKMRQKNRVPELSMCSGPCVSCASHGILSYLFVVDVVSVVQPGQAAAKVMHKGPDVIPARANSDTSKKKPQPGISFTSGKSRRGPSTPPVPVRVLVDNKV